MCGQRGAGRRLIGAEEVPGGAGNGRGGPEKTSSKLMQGCFHGGKGKGVGKGEKQGMRVDGERMRGYGKGGMQVYAEMKAVVQNEYNSTQNEYNST